MNAFRYERIYPPLIGKDGEKYKYRMLESYTFDIGKFGIRPLVDLVLPFITVSRSGLMTVLAGYVWDGATGGIDSHNFMRPSAGHDGLYRLIRLLIYP